MHLVFHHCVFVVNRFFIIVFLQQQVFCDDYDTVMSMCTVDNAKAATAGCLLFCCCYQHMRTDLEVLYRTTHL